MPSSSSKVRSHPILLSPDHPFLSQPPPPLLRPRPASLPPCRSVFLRPPPSPCPTIAPAPLFTHGSARRCCGREQGRTEPAAALLCRRGLRPQPPQVCAGLGKNGARASGERDGHRCTGMDSESESESESERGRAVCWVWDHCAVLSWGSGWWIHSATHAGAHATLCCVLRQLLAELLRFHGQCLPQQFPPGVSHHHRRAQDGVRLAHTVGEVTDSTRELHAGLTTVLQVLA